MVLVFITRYTVKNTTIHLDVDIQYFKLRFMMYYNVQSSIACSVQIVSVAIYSDSQAALKYDTIRCGRFMCAQKLTRSPA